MPSTDGKRVDVQIDPTLLGKAEKEAKTKEKKEIKKENNDTNKEVSVVDIIHDDGSRFDEKTILEYLGTLNKPQRGTGAVKKEKTEKTAGGTKEKKVKSEKEDVGGGGGSGGEDQVVTKTTKTAAKVKSESTSPKAATGKASKKAEEKAKTIDNYFKKSSSKKKKNESSDEEMSLSGDDDESEFGDNDIDMDDDGEPKTKRTIARARKACNYKLDESDDESKDSVEVKKKKKGLLLTFQLVLEDFRKSENVGLNFNYFCLKTIRTMKS